MYRENFQPDYCVCEYFLSSVYMISMEMGCGGVTKSRIRKYE